jgi:hypothetical protein
VRSLEFSLFGIVSIESSGRPESLTPLVFLCFFFFFGEVLFLWKVFLVYSEAGGGGGGWYVALLPAPALRFVLELIAPGIRLLTWFTRGAGV